MPGVTPEIDRPRWWFGLRGFAFCLVGGGLGCFAYVVVVSHRLGAASWGWLLFASILSGTFSALFPRRRQR